MRAKGRFSNEGNRAMIKQFAKKRQNTIENPNSKKKKMKNSEQ